VAHREVGIWLCRDSLNLAIPLARVMPSMMALLACKYSVLRTDRYERILRDMCSRGGRSRVSKAGGGVAGPTPLVRESVRLLFWHGLRPPRGLRSLSAGRY
jgi:hypothetical protein